jgi:hypothetical protein
MNYRFIGIYFLMLSSCATDPWTEDEKAEFILGCENEGAERKYCECFMKNVMEKFPRYEDSYDISFEEAVELSKDCK